MTYKTTNIYGYWEQKESIRYKGKYLTSWICWEMDT